MVVIDSMNFMNSSLDELVKNLADNDFKHLSQDFNGEQLNSVKQKGVYPYEYMNKFETNFEDKLPNRRKFYTSLKNGCISEKYGYIGEKDYFHAVNVCNKFKMNSLVDYHDLCLKADALLLNNVFEGVIN